MWPHPVIWVHYGCSPGVALGRQTHAGSGPGPFHIQPEELSGLAWARAEPSLAEPSVERTTTGPRTRMRRAVRKCR